MRFFYTISMGLSIWVGLMCVGESLLHAQPSLTFTENRGQWHEAFTHSYRSNAIEFYVQSSGWHLYILPPREIEHAGERHMTYNLPEGHKTGIPEGSIYGMSFEFIGAKRKEPARGLLSSRAITNYFLGSDSTKWATEVRSFSSLGYCDLYEGVDLYLHRVAGRLLKYDWVVRPGGDLGQVRMRIKGAEGVSLRDDGSLHISTPYGPLVEHLPLVYQLKGKDTLRISCEYVLSGDEIGFKVGAYEPSLPLIVDPELIAASYTGSTVDNWGNTATFDRLGTVYTGGVIFGTSTGKYRPTSGAIQGSMSGGRTDVSLTRFNASGASVLYFTYLGGKAVEIPTSTILHPSGDLIVYGVTSSDNFPTTSGAFSSRLSRGSQVSVIDPYSSNIVLEDSDIFLARLSSKGNRLIGSTYVGGTAIDGSSDYDFPITSGNYGDTLRGEVIIDTDGHIVVASWTQSEDFPTSSRSPEEFHGQTEGILFKMSEGLSSLIWNVFVGGSKDDLLYSVKATEKGYFVTGNTTSETMNFPENPFSEKNRHPSLQPTRHESRGSTKDQVDGFVAFIDRETLNITRGTYLGTGRFDAAMLLDIGPQGNVHVVGQTRGNYESRAPTDMPAGEEFYSNSGGKVFIHALTPQLNKTVWATTIGSTPVSLAPNISPTAFQLNSCGQIYLSGWGGSINTEGQWENSNTHHLPLSTTPAPYQKTTDGEDFYLIALDSSALGDEPIYATYFGGRKSRDHVDGGTSKFDKLGVVYHAVCASCGGNNDFPTTKDAFSKSNKSSNCNLAFFKFQFSGISARLETNNEEGSKPGFSVGCAPLTVMFSDKSNGAERSEWDLGDGKGFREIEEKEFLHTFEETGSYEVVLKIFNSESCRRVKESRTLITVLDEPRAFSSDQSICEGESLRLYASGGISYAWEPPTGLSDSRVSNPVASPTETTTYRVTLRTPGGCVASKSIQVTVLPRLEASFDRLQRGNACLGNRSATFRARAVEATQITWHMGDGTSYQGEEIEHTYEASGSYTVRLEVSNEGCFAQASEVVQARDIFLTNAITPNGDGKNDQLVLISESPLRLSIYDRNGAPVYESKAYTNDWSGENLPGGVYFYNLKLPTDENCKGWIHLIRTEG